MLGRVKPSRIRPWQVLSETTLVERYWLSIKEQHVRLGNGSEIEQFHLIHGPSWAAVLCLTVDDQVVFVRQYRHGAGGLCLELPAGVIDANEGAEQAARRELLEETGFQAPAFEPLLSVVPEPARNTARAALFFAREGKCVRAPALDANEDMEVVLVPRAEIPELVESGEIVHGVHIAALLLALRRGWL
jgi:8-oxo-dGTP pyrophosphatase MutT (NUDIX family)